jgi:hypothetical protein
MEAALPAQYEEYATAGNSARQFNASIDGVVVGTAAAVRGPAALTIQAGRMSKPIVEQLGFTLVGRARVYVDDFAGA